MKKILFLLLCTVSIYGQTYQNPTYGTLTLKTNVESTTANKIPAQETSGLINWLQPVNIPIPLTPANYTVSSPTLGGHLTGIDNKFAAVTATTAGISTRVWWTADVTVVSAINYYATNPTSKGTAASAIQSVVNDDNQKKYYTQDLIGAAFATDVLFPPGTYAGNLSASTTPNSAQQRWTVELYKCDNLGTPIASGVSGAVVGDLGVTTITILDSGLLTLADGSVTNVQVSGTVGAGGLSMLSGQRIRYHVSAEKVGTTASNITQSVYYGTSYNSFLDVPVTLNTSGVQNLSDVDGQTTTEALNNLLASIPVNYSKIVYVNNTNPNSATIFDLENPPTVNDNALKTDTANLYIGTDASTWVYNGSIYITKAVTSDTSNFWYKGTAVPAGNSKTATLTRNGGAEFLASAGTGVYGYSYSNTGISGISDQSIGLYAGTVNGSKIASFNFGVVEKAAISSAGNITANAIDTNTTKITITTSISITTATLDANGIRQDGRHVVIDNGVNAINLTCNGGVTTSYGKVGTGAITFVQGSGRTLVQLSGTAVFNGIAGSTATLWSNGTTDYLAINNY